MPARPLPAEIETADAESRHTHEIFTEERGFFEMSDLNPLEVFCSLNFGYLPQMLHKTLTLKSRGG